MRLAPNALLSQLPAACRWMAAAFVYWFAFMGALTPGVLAGVSEVDWSRELIRLTACGLLGAAATPVLLFLADRYRLEPRPRAGNLLRQAAALPGLSVVLILASCLLAAWVLQGRLLPSARDIAEETRANLLLVALCLALFLAFIQLIDRKAAPSAAKDDRFMATTRGETVVIDLSAVEWIEAQGNYQAFHARGAAHLVRATSAEVERRLGDRFVRVHRGGLVAVGKVARLTPLGNGDAIVEMVSGMEIRVSRLHRARLRAALEASMIGISGRG
ncbi:MAG: LytTR family DNA-binding domain-containing protein [Caulobacter sp.]